METETPQPCSPTSPAESATVASEATLVSDENFTDLEDEVPTVGSDATLLGIQPSGSCLKVEGDGLKSEDLDWLQKVEHSTEVVTEQLKLEPELKAHLEEASSEQLMEASLEVKAKVLEASSDKLKLEEKEEASEAWTELTMPKVEDASMEQMVDPELLQMDLQQALASLVHLEEAFVDLLEATARASTEQPFVDAAEGSTDQPMVDVTMEAASTEEPMLHMTAEGAMEASTEEPMLEVTAEGAMEASTEEQMLDEPMLEVAEGAMEAFAEEPQLKMEAFTDADATMAAATDELPSEPPPLPPPLGPPPQPASSSSSAVPTSHSTNPIFLSTSPTTSTTSTTSHPARCDGPSRPARDAEGAPSHQRAVSPALRDCAGDGKAPAWRAAEVTKRSAGDLGCCYACARVSAGCV